MFALLGAGALAGAAVMVVELSATRLFAPWFGSSIYCWTNVIAVVMVCLATGYTIGGRLADRRPRASFLGWILIAGGALLLPAPLLAPFLAPGLMPAPEFSDPASAASSVVTGSLAATLLLFGPPLVLLGCVCPFLTRLVVDQGVPSGRASGQVLAWSTAGSLVGTYLPAHVLLESVGSRGSIFTAAAVVALAGFVLLGNGRGRAAAALLLILAAGGTAFSRHSTFVPAVADEVVVSERESPYQYVRVARWSAAPGRPAATNLSLDEGLTEFHSRRLDDSSGLTGAYYDYFAVLPDWIPGIEATPAQVLILGGAAGTMRGELRRFQAARVRSVTDVEIDPLVAALAPDFGGPPAPADRLIVADARVALEHLAGPFDLIVLDAYARQLSIPSHLASEECFRRMKSRLTNRGLLALNVSVADVDSPLCRALTGTLLRTFSTVHSVSVEGSWNVVLIAGEPALPHVAVAERGDALDSARKRFRRGFHRLATPETFTLLTDDRAPLETLARAIR